MSGIRSRHPEPVDGRGPGNSVQSRGHASCQPWTSCPPQSPGRPPNPLFSFPYSLFATPYSLFSSTPFRATRILPPSPSREPRSGPGVEGRRRRPGRSRDGGAIYRVDRQDPGRGEGQRGGRKCQAPPTDVDGEAPADAGCRAVSLLPLRRGIPCPPPGPFSGGRAMTRAPAPRKALRLCKLRAAQSLALPRHRRENKLHASSRHVGRRRFNKG